MRNYELRSVTPSDEPALTALFKAAFGQDRSPDEWRWKFTASRELAQGFTPAASLVAIDASDGAVAHAGVVTLPGTFRGQPIPFVQVCDVMVHPRHRGGMGRNNLFTLLLRRLLSDVASDLPSAFRYGFPGRRPYLIGAKSRVYDEIEIASRFTAVDQGRRPTPTWTTPLAWEDSRIDAIWQQLGSGIGLGLVRDSAYLRWRYAQSPIRDYLLLGVRHWGRLVGWVVVHDMPDERRVVDFLVPQSLIRATLQAAARGAAQGKASAWIPQDWRSHLNLDRVDTPVVVANMLWGSRIETGTARQTLFYTMGDVDIF